MGFWQHAATLSAFALIAAIIVFVGRPDHHAETQPAMSALVAHLAAVAK